MLNTDTALLIVDYQQAFNDRAFWGLRNNPAAEDNAARVLGACRKSGIPVIHVRHDSVMPTSPLHPQHPGNRPMAFALPLDDEPVLSKQVNSSFIGTDLEARLKAMGVTTLIIMGVSTDHCISTTTRMAANLGFKVHLVGDACFAFDRKAVDGSMIEAATVHRVELAILHGEFAEVISTAMLLDGLKHSADLEPRRLQPA
ncbi:MAG: cysteine hydrolase [Beijerinckiaceae bacterium]|nr:cysteine hydrolase [Beijerinckiaceae bacterium]